jgi:hypothetical protein
VNADDLEAVLRRELTAVAVAAIHATPRGLTLRMNAAVDTSLNAARAFALDEYGITADRRNVLADAVAPRGRKPR